MSDTCPQCGSPSKRGTNRPIDAPSLICSDPWHGVLPVEPQPAKDKQQCEACGTFCEVRVGLSLRGPMVCGFCFDRRAELRAKFTLDGKPLENATFEIPPAVETVPPEDVAGILKGVEEMNAGQTKSITEIRKELSALGVPPYAKGGGDFIDSMEALCKFLVEHGIENIDDLRQRLRPVAGVVPQGAEPINSRQLLNRWKNGSISQQKAYRSIVGAGLVKQCCNFAESFALAHAAASQAAGASSMSAEQFAATWEAPMRRDHSRYASALAEAYAAELKAKIAELQHEIIELSQATPPKPSPDVCKAQRTADPPQDCDWPFCGCDPSADKVIEAIQESGFSIVKDEDLLRMSTATHSPDIHKLAADLRVKWTAWLNSFGVPISQQFAEFAEAVGKITDLERAGLADETAPAKEKP